MIAYALAGVFLALGIAQAVLVLLRLNRPAAAEKADEMDEREGD